MQNRRIPVIADEYVDREFGTGALKITPAHDFNDFEISQKRSRPRKWPTISPLEVYRERDVPD